MNHIPVSEQQQVQTDSNLIEIVCQWTVDPSFCRPRANAITTPPSIIDLEDDEDDDLESDLEISCKSLMQTVDKKQESADPKTSLQEDAIQESPAIPNGDLIIGEQCFK